MGPEISPQLHLRSEQTHRSALQWEGDNILQRRPDPGKKVLVHPNADGDWRRLFETSSKSSVGAESVTCCKTVTIPSSGAFQLRSLATPTQQCPARARAEEGGKNRHRSPALPRHSTSLHRGFSSSRQFHSTSASSKNGESRANSLVARCGVGVGGSTPPRSNSGGSGYFLTHSCDNCVGKYSGGRKNPPAAENRSDILRRSGNALRWRQKIPSSTPGTYQRQSRAFHRLHILGPQNARSGPRWAGKIVPGLVPSGVSSPSSPFSATHRSVTKCNKLEYVAQNVPKRRGRAFPSLSVTPFDFSWWSK